MDRPALNQTFPSGQVPIGTVGHVGGVPYTFIYNFTGDATQPASQSLDLLCRTITAAVIQFQFETTVTGTIGFDSVPWDPTSAPVNVIHVHVIQINTFVDKVV